jgi:hypothetical protein
LRNLFDEAQLRAFANSYFAGAGLDASDEYFEQRGFAGTVGADQADALAFRNGERNIFEKRSEAITLRQLLGINDGRQKIQCSPENSLTLSIPAEVRRRRAIREIEKALGRKNNSQL